MMTAALLAIVSVCIAPSEARPPSDADELEPDLGDTRYLRSIVNCRILPSCHEPRRAGELPAVLSFDRDLIHSIENI
jgi:hypothetical protein